MAGSVCKRCFQWYPEDLTLISLKCRGGHGYVGYMNVRWNNQRERLEQVNIRPMPQVKMRSGAKFLLCDGKRCIGENCTYAHSIEEQDAWNNQLTHVGSTWHTLLAYNTGDWPTLQGGSTGSSGHTLLAYNPGDWPTLQGGIQHHGSTLMNKPLLPMYSLVSSGSGRHEIANFHTGPESATGQYHHDQASTMLSQFLPLTTHHSQGIPQGADAISVSELESQIPSTPSRTFYQQDPSASIFSLSTVRHQPASAGINSSQKKINYYRDDVLYAPLSRENYKEKFDQLVKAEKESHEGILRERCNNSYRFMMLGSQCPKGIHVKYPESYQLYGCLEGISSDNLAYINQASTSVTLVKSKREMFTADVYRQHHQKKLIVAFKSRECSKALRSGSRVQVTFNLKESYFNDLLNSIRYLSPAIISRIIPNLKSFEQLLLTSPNLEDFVQYCSREQVNALRKIVAAPPNGPPVLLIGAFGTGKSRLLSLSVRFFQRCQSGNNPVRVLVCTQQRISADKFLEYYIETWLESEQGRVLVIREYGYDQISSEYKDYYMTSKEFKEIYKYENNILVITTCLTAPHLNFLPRGYFTHILIDEGSQMREPEAVAPLYLTDDKTQLIIAGDPNQVGPALLVLGDIPQKNGLGISLLQRLQCHYEKLGELAQDDHIVTLSTNYRCHSDILSFVGSLFYDSPLTWTERDQPPILHHQYKFPLAFVCSDTNRDIIRSTDHNENEAKILVEKALEVARGSPSGWPKPPMSSFFIVSPCEEQVFIIKNLLWNKKLHSEPEVKSTINIQGREFQAVFLSTTEPINADGSTRNPTRSLCDPYVFNTAITRTKSLVLCVGNPFLLLKIESQMVKQYGKRGKCWSTFLKRCLEHNSLTFDKNIPLLKQEECMKQLKEDLFCGSNVDDHDELERLKKRNKELEAKLAEKPDNVQSNQTNPLMMMPLTIQPSQYHFQQHQERPFLVQPNFMLEHNPSVNQFHLPYPDTHPPYPDSHMMGAELSDDSEQTTPRLMSQESADIKPYNYAQPFQSQFHVQRAPQTPDHKPQFMERPDMQRLTPASELLSQTSHSPNHQVYDTDMHRLTLASELVSQTSHPPNHGSLHEMEGSGAKHFEKIGTLGYGEFGVVNHARRKRDGMEFALKVIPLESQSGVHSSKWREANALKNLKDQKIVEYIDSWEEEASVDWLHRSVGDSPREGKRCLFILTELCEKDTLKDWLMKHNGKDSRNRKGVVNFFEQIVEALCFIHEKKYIHRDLKPSNIFFSRESENCLKVGDFGLVTFDQSDGDGGGDSSGNMERPTTESGLQGAGTFPYISPEQQDPSWRKHIDAKTDIYSLGIILFELHYPKKIDQEEKSEVFSGVREGHFPNQFRERLTKVYELVKLLTNIRPKRRPSAVEIREQLVELKRVNRKTKKKFIPVL